LVMAVAIRRRWLSNLSFACLIAFWLLHILGARYIYSFVPYEVWLDRLFGGSPAGWFGWRRNHFDRLVHFSFGFLWMFPAVELAMRWGGMRRSWAAMFGLCFVLAGGSLYEVAEWILAVVMSPAQAEAYNGQQGDMWDAQKDMALQFVAGLLAMPLAVWQLNSTHHPDRANEHD
jgi:putative membrane protein